MVFMAFLTPQTEAATDGAESRRRWIYRSRGCSIGSVLPSRCLQLDKLGEAVHPMLRVVDARDNHEFFATCFLELLFAGDTQLLTCLQAVDGKGWRGQCQTSDTALGQLGKGLVCVRSKPFNRVSQRQTALESH